MEPKLAPNLEIPLAQSLPGVARMIDRHGLALLGFFFFLSLHWPIKIALVNGSLLYWKETC